MFPRTIAGTIPISTVYKRSDPFRCKGAGMLRFLAARGRRRPTTWLIAILAASLLVGAQSRALDPASSVQAQENGPVMLDSNLGVRAFVTGLTMPTSMAFIGPGDLFVLEKTTGQV